MAPAVIWTCKSHARSCKSAPSALDLFAGSDILAPQQDNAGRYEVMMGSKTIYNEMVDIVSRYATDDGEHTTSIDGLIFGRRTSPTQLLHTSARPCFALVLQGEKSLTLGNEVYRYGFGDYLVISIELPVRSQVTQASETTPLLGFGMAINPDRLKEVMGRVSLVRSTIPPDEMRGVAVNKAAPELLDASLRLLRLLDAPQDIPFLAPLIEAEILYRLLSGPFGARLRQIAITETPSNQIAAAIAWLKENFMRHLRIEELADRVGMSVSALHHQFKAVTAMTPMQYQKQLRLHEARRLMLVELLDVGSAGYAVGYQSPSQFSREYTRLYGKSPLRDVGGLRVAPAGASTNLPQKSTQLPESGGPTREHSLRS
jgi:AraC-like DNA-binding protein